MNDNAERKSACVWEMGSNAFLGVAQFTGKLSCMSYVLCMRHLRIIRMCPL